MSGQALSRTGISINDCIREKNEKAYVEGDQGDLNSVDIVVILCPNKYFMLR